LYALSQRNGSIQWAVRLGIDATTLPVRVAGPNANTEMALVVSTDTNTLLALDVRSGEMFWKRHLGARCAGRPVIVDRLAYVPSCDGRIHEIDLADGHVV